MKNTLKYLCGALLGGLLVVGTTDTAFAARAFLEFQGADQQDFCSATKNAGGLPACDDDKCGGITGAGKCGEKLAKACVGKEKGEVVCGTYKTPAGASCVQFRECKGDEKSFLSNSLNEADIIKEFLHY